MPAEQAANPGIFVLIPYVIIFLVFYVIAIKPEKEKQRRHRERISNLKKNDQIVTTGGIHATVIQVKPATMIVRIDDSVKIEIDKEAVTAVKEKAAEDGKP